MTTPSTSNTAPPPLWEQHKENAAPLERGRNISVLEQSFQSAPADKEPLVRHFEARVRPYEGDAGRQRPLAEDEDPLIDWLAYIKFHQEVCPADRNGEFLLLERCFRSLLGHDRYRDDVRFVRLCCLYAEATSRTQEVFKHLYRRKVGLGTSIFWAAWAFQAERDGDFKLANQILTKGMEKYKARPTEFLQRRYLQFQRRFVKHLASQAEATDLEPEEYEQGGGRGALGGLSQEAVRRNDRAQAAFPRARAAVSRTATYHDTFRANQQRQRSNVNNDENVALGGVAFAIYTDENNGGSVLDDSFYTPGHDRILERERDLRKENTMDAEAWNQRGGIGAYGNDFTSGSIVDYSHGHMQPSISFSVHVDEECLVQHQRKEATRRDKEQQMRNHRDERAFHEREEGRSHMAELLVQDPLRYTRDPSLLETDNLVSAAAERTTNHKCKRPAGKLTRPLGQKTDSAQGFDPKLLTNELGAEQCFEEARVRAGYYALSAYTSFNMLRRPVVEIQESGSDGDVSMEEDSVDQELLPSDPRSRPEPEVSEPSGHRISTIDSVPKTPCAQERTPCNQSTIMSGSRPPRSNRKQRLSYEQNSSYLSGASSGIDEAIAVGLPSGKEEQTINTALARKELSMMFGSPMLAPITEGFRYEEFSMGATLGNFASSESFALNDSVDATKLSAIPKSTSAAIFSTSKDMSDNAEKPSEREKLDFCIFEETSSDKSEKDTSKVCEQGRTVGFAICNDGTTGGPYSGDNAETAPTGMLADVLGLDSSHHANDPKEEVKDKDQVVGTCVFSIFKDESFKSDGDETAPTEMIANALSMCDSSNPSILPQSTRMNQSPTKNSNSQVPSIANEDETATLSDIAGLFSQATKSGKNNLQLFSRGDLSRIDENDVQTADMSLTLRETMDVPLPGFGDVSGIAYVEDEATLMLAGLSVKKFIDYTSVYASEIKVARQRLEARGKRHLPVTRSLTEVFASQGLVSSSPTDVIPREFRLSALPKGTEIKVGRKRALVTAELGRGSFGVVVSLGDVLIDNENASEKASLAVKVQRPTTCLALEFEILQKLQVRFQKNNKDAIGICFPRALAYLSLADGAMMSMTAGSSSGMSIVDLVNAYKSRQQSSVPGILALHYTARMLHHLELLHWHAKVLHCDTKPDNWIISCSDINSKGYPILGAEIMLVDFGRAMDLESLAEQAKSEATEVLLAVNEWPESMQCVSMRLGLPWSFDVDTFGACATAHVLLFGAHMEVALNSSERWMPTESFEDCEHQDMWTKIFDSLLNLDEISKTPMGSHPSSVRRLRTEIEAYLSTRRENLVSALEEQAKMLQQTVDS